MMPTQIVSNSSYYAKILKANTALQSVFLGMKHKRTVMCNQSSYAAKTLKAITALRSVCLGMKPERTVVCSQSSNYSKSVKGEYNDAISIP